MLLEVTVNADPEPTAVWSREGGAQLTGDRYKATSSRAGNDFTYAMLITVSATFPSDFLNFRYIFFNLRFKFSFYIDGITLACCNGIAR